MPDGFTPVSMELFDSQVSLIATKYTLQGINVLVHCRGEFPSSLRLRPRDRACVYYVYMRYLMIDTVGSAVPLPSRLSFSL